MYVFKTVTKDLNIETKPSKLNFIRNECYVTLKSDTKSLQNQQARQSVPLFQN